MSKKLSEMSLDELWQLFPIYLTEHNENWTAWYADEERHLKNHLPIDQIKRISHIGSTAVNGIWAKPIIDILVEVTSESDLQQVKAILEQAGYLCMSESSDGYRSTKAIPKTVSQTEFSICTCGKPAIMMNCIFGII